MQDSGGTGVDGGVPPSAGVDTDLESPPSAPAADSPSVHAAARTANPLPSFLSFNPGQPPQNVATIARTDVRFMDVGVWAGGFDGRATTTFGIVHQNAVLLCSWLNLVENGVDPNGTPQPVLPGSSETLSNLPQKVEDFFDEGRGITGHGIPRRGWVIKNAPLQTQLTDNDEFLVILPDLHLPLYVDSPLDRFRFKPPGSSTVSLGLDLELSLLKQIVKSPRIGGTLVQVGDLYEVWESEIMLRMHYDEMRSLSSPPAGIQETLNTGKVVPVRDYRNWRGSAIATPSPTRAKVRQDGIDFTSTDAIVAAIRKAHPNLFGVNGTTPFFDQEIFGNHDNHLRNAFWPSHAPANYQSHPRLGNATTAGSQPQKILRTGIGNGKIWIDHGHYYDPDNNDTAWDGSGKGFGMVFLMIQHLIVTAFQRAGTLIPVVGGFFALPAQQRSDLAREIANFGASIGFNFDMRLGTNRLADDIVSHPGGVNLVVCGHTHEPRLEFANSRNARFIARVPRHQSYTRGSRQYLVKRARRLGDATP